MPVGSPGSCAHCYTWHMSMQCPWVGHMWVGDRAFKKYLFYCSWGKVIGCKETRTHPYKPGHPCRMWEVPQPLDGKHRHKGHTEICFSTACRDTPLPGIEVGLWSSIQWFCCGFHHLLACHFPINVINILLSSARGCYALLEFLDRWPSMLREERRRTEHYNFKN